MASSERSTRMMAKQFKVFSDAFFPKPPQNSSVPAEYNYPKPLPASPLITYSQIEIYIQCLSPYKASGPDEIPNIMLQKAFLLITDYLLHIFQAIFALKIYYEPWKHFTMVILHKLEKPNYEIPKVYCLIALFCTIAKVLTAIVAEDVSCLVKKHQLISANHCSRRPGRTTTDALHYLVYKIKDA
jgi:hypothetical protein